MELPDLTGYDLVCLTSVNGVDRLFELVRDARSLAGPTIAAIGPGTAERLREHGVVADVVPARAVGEGLLEAVSALDAGARSSCAPARAATSCPTGCANAASRSTS